jgi:hypothetical protein
MIGSSVDFAHDRASSQRSKADDRAPFAPIGQLGPAVSELVQVRRVVRTIGDDPLRMAATTRHHQRRNEGNAER